MKSLCQSAVNLKVLYWLSRFLVANEFVLLRTAAQKDGELLKSSSPAQAGEREESDLLSLNICTRRHMGAVAITNLFK